MKTITIKNLDIQFDADQITSGKDKEKALELINLELQRQPLEITMNNEQHIKDLRDFALASYVIEKLTKDTPFSAIFSLQQRARFLNAGSFKPSADVWTSGASDMLKIAGIAGFDIKDVMRRCFHRTRNSNAQRINARTVENVMGEICEHTN